MTTIKPFEDLLARFRAKRPIRSGSLIITVFGDAISQHGNNVWLGSLIRVLEPFGLSQRLVRTSVYRLIQDGWLSSHQIGRRSYYSFSDYGMRHFRKAAERIYSTDHHDWDGIWTLVIPAGLQEKERERLRKELLWLGYGSIAPGMLARPSRDRCALDETIAELELQDKVLILQASTTDLYSEEVIRRMACDCWKLDQLSLRYGAFLDDFRPVQAAVQQTSSVDRATCFRIRTLLIHEYRRLLLSDTDLPDALLSADWPGLSAATLVANLYRSVHGGAEKYLLEQLENAEGPLPRADSGYFQRFGGLE